MFLFIISIAQRIIIGLIATIGIGMDIYVALKYGINVVIALGPIALSLAIFVGLLTIGLRWNRSNKKSWKYWYDVVLYTVISAVAGTGILFIEVSQKTTLIDMLLIGVALLVVNGTIQGVAWIKQELAYDRQMRQQQQDEKSV